MSGIWNWSAAGRVDEALIGSALSAVLGRPVHGMVQDSTDSAVLCDVYQVGGAPPTPIDLYLLGAVQNGMESESAAAVAVRLGTALLFPDESLNPTRYLLAERDGTVGGGRAYGTEGGGG